MSLLCSDEEEKREDADGWVGMFCSERDYRRCRAAKERRVENGCSKSIPDIWSEVAETIM